MVISASLGTSMTSVLWHCFERTVARARRFHGSWTHLRDLRPNLVADAGPGAYGRSMQVFSRRQEPGGSSRPRRRTRRAIAAVTAASVLGASVAFVTPWAAATKRVTDSGSVDVLYAGSLVRLMHTAIGTAFKSATGYSVTGVSEGSTALATEIKGGVHQADVFVSASAKSDQGLMGAANGNWVTWYLTFATSPLLLGYNSASRFAKTLKSEPWWKVITKSGFLLGRTNPVTDPKGVLALKALDAAARQHHDSAVAALGSKSTNVFPEQTMVGRLQAGQLDAGFFYADEAVAAKFPTVPLSGVHEKASYTITVVARAPHPTAADAFVAFMLSASARKLMARNGLTQVAPPSLSG